MLSSNKITLEAKLSYSPMLQYCFYSKRENTKNNFYGGKTRNNLESVEMTTTDLVRSCQVNDPLLSSIELTSEAKFNDLPLTQPCLYFKRENSKINNCGENARDYLECKVISSDLENGPRCYPCLYLCADSLIFGYVYITNTAVALNKMVKTPLGSCYLSSMRNCLVETERSMKDKKRGQKGITLYAGIHPFDTHSMLNVILIMVMENNDCKGKN